VVLAGDEWDRLSDHNPVVACFGLKQVRGKMIAGCQIFQVNVGGFAGEKLTSPRWCVTFFIWTSQITLPTKRPVILSPRAIYRCRSNFSKIGSAVVASRLICPRRGGPSQAGRGGSPTKRSRRMGLNLVEHQFDRRIQLRILTIHHERRGVDDLDVGPYKEGTLRTCADQLIKASLSILSARSSRPGLQSNCFTRMLRYRTNSFVISPPPCTWSPI
jgi:hypothetical protein